MRKAHLAVAACLSLVLAPACKSRDSNKSSAPSAEKGAEQGASAPEEALVGGHIKLPSNEPLYLNPLLETRFNRATLLIFEGLVGLDAQMQPVPRLAESWEISSDHKTITFTLQKDLKWSDGKPLTSADVAFTVEALKQTRAPSVWKTYFTALDRVETPDPMTVKAYYQTPYAPALVSWTMGLIPQHIFGGGDIADSPANKDPVGSGPFKLSRWEGGLMVLVANEQHWGGRPNLDSIELVFHVSDQLQALNDGKIDFANIKGIAKWATDAQLPEFRDNFEVTTEVESLFRLIAWNTTKKPFNDPRVRRALTMALNRQRVIDDVLLGQAQAVSAPFSPNMFGADPSIAPHPFDLDRATKLFDEAGVPSKGGRRFSIGLITMESQRIPVNEEMFAIFRHDLAAIGIDLTVEYLSPAEFESRVMKRSFDAAFFGWLRDIPDPDPSALLHSGMIDAGQNFAAYKNEEVDRLLEEAAKVLNRDERKSLYHKLHAILHEEMPYTVIYAPFSHYAWRRTLRGVNPRDIGPQVQYPGVARWRLAPAK